MIAVIFADVLMIDLFLIWGGGVIFCDSIEDFED